MTAGFLRRLMLALALLLVVYGGVVALLARQALQAQEQETQQRLSKGLARHIVQHWPEVGGGDRFSPSAQDRVLQMLMVVNPGIQVYLLDARGHVVAYLGEPGMVQQPQVDLAPVRRFLDGAPMPLLGTDPMGGPPRVFSAARFEPAPGATQPAGYLYVVLEGAGRAALAGAASARHTWQGVVAAAAVALAATLALGALLLGRLTLPLNRLAARMRSFTLGEAPAGVPEGPAHDEVQALGQAFDTLSARIDAQVREREAQAAQHREVIASVAHDLRTPLTALHGQLEALALPPADDDAQRRARIVAAALGQSDKVRRLSQQLFELATLQSTEQVAHRERFRLDELVADTVHKFERGSGAPAVALVGGAPGPVEMEGDLHLIERALSNLIDNALRHAAGSAAVQVSLACDGPQATVLVEDSGPGLPAELARRLDAGQPLRDPPLRRPGGGIGGLGLAIAQRIAVLHGGSLRTLGGAGSGTRLALALPLNAAA